MPSNPPSARMTCDCKLDADGGLVERVNHCRLDHSGPVYRPHPPSARMTEPPEMPDGEADYWAHGATPRLCSHYWIDPNDPPIQRASYSPIMGPGRREMKEGATYRCLNCKQTLVATKGKW